MFEVITDITTEAGGGQVSVMYFDEGGTSAAAAVLSATLFWQACAAKCTVSTTFQVRGSGRTVDAADGSLSGFYSEPSSALILGSVSGSGVPDASQVLCQFRTGVIRAGREVRGRTFVPGLAAANNLAGGNLFEATRLIFAAAAEQLTEEERGHGIWARPKEGSPGVLVKSATGDCWTELAVLRRRRQ